MWCVCQTHDSYEHSFVSPSQQCSEVLSTIDNLDALSSKCSKVDWIHYFTQNGVDSLCHSQNASEFSETSHSPLNIEDELLDYVEIELPDISTQDKGPDMLSKKLATKSENLWQNPNSKVVVKVFTWHKHPADRKCDSATYAKANHENELI